MDPLSQALSTVEASQTAKANALSQQSSDAAKLAALQTAISTDAVTVSAATTQADSDLTALITLAQSMLSTAPAPASA